MKNKDLIKTLLDFNLDADVIILTKEEDIIAVNGQNVPGIKFGSLGNDNTILAIVGDYDIFKNKKDEAIAEESTKENN